MGDLRVGDWTVIDGQIMEVTGFHGAVPVVRPLTSSPVTLEAGWAGEGVPAQPVPQGPPILMDPGKAAQVEQIRAAMRLARANPGREVVFDLPLDEPENP
jgi:hypothetical protein